MVLLHAGDEVKSNSERLRQALGLSNFKRLVIHPDYLESVDSTQTYLSDKVKSEREGDFVMSEIQTLGIGRDGRSWVSQRGGLWMTIVLTPPSPRVLEKIIYLGANAIVTTLADYRITTTIKPPNDVYCVGRKIAGILTDTVIQGKLTVVYLGIGVNVNNDTSKEISISELATSVSKIIGRKTDLIEFTATLLKKLDHLYFEEIEAQISHN